MSVKALRILYEDEGKDLFDVSVVANTELNDAGVPKALRQTASLSILGQFPVVVDSDEYAESVTSLVLAYKSELQQIMTVSASQPKQTVRTYGQRQRTVVRGGGTTTTEEGQRKRTDAYGERQEDNITTKGSETITSTESFATAGGPNVAPVRQEAHPSRSDQELRDAQPYTDTHTDAAHTTTVTDPQRTDTDTAGTYTDTEEQTITPSERADLTSAQWDKIFSVLRRILADSAVYACVVRW